MRTPLYRRLVQVVHVASLAGVLLLITGESAHARRQKFGFEVEPLIGYERVQKVVPTAHTAERMFYGARVTAGFLFLAAEAEGTRGTDTEISGGTTYKDSADKVKLGLRSKIKMGKAMSLVARGGAQGKWSKTETTTGGVTTMTKAGPVYHPYAGLGLSALTTKNTSITGAVTVVFNDFPDMSKNEYQTSLSYQISFGN